MYKTLYKGISILLIFFLFLTAYANPRDSFASKNLIILIGDGMGTSQVTLARLYAQKFLGQDKLAMDSIYVGSNTTYAAPDKAQGLTGAVTDSAASATAIATGGKTYNGAISVTNEPMARPLATLLEAAKIQGKSIGVITTTSVSHATPAAFLAHVRDRDMEPAIAAQYLETDADVIMGGGESFFVTRAQDSHFGLANRDDGLNYLDLFNANGYTIVHTKQALLESQADKLLGLFAAVHIPYVLDRDESVPTLTEQLDKALTILARNSNGFVLMLEGGRIDHAGHLNDPSGVIHETLEFDQAVSYALDYAAQYPDTSIIVTADHETGGMSIGRDGIYDVDLDVLAKVNSSSVALAELITQAQSNTEITDLVKNHFGIEDLTEVELATILANKPSIPLPPTESFSISAKPAAVLSLAEELNHILSKRALIGWTGGGHTGEDVGVYSAGPVSELLTGLTDDTYLAKVSAMTLGLDLELINEKLQTKYLYPDHWIIEDGQPLFSLTEIADVLGKKMSLSTNNTEDNDYLQLTDISHMLAIHLAWDPLSERIIIG